MTIDAAYARLPATYAIFPMIAVQSTSKSDHLTYNPNKKTRKVRHFITHSKHRERLLSKLMRPNEIFILMLCPVFFALHLALKLVSKQKNGFATRNHS